MNPTIKKTLFTIGFPFSPFYSQLMILRAFLYKKELFKVHTLQVPVISVGNLTMGGTGKTPLVMYLARHLIAGGYKPAVISRGYRGRSRAPVNIVSDGTQIFMNAVQSGDEPWLLANGLSGVVVATGKQRILPCKEVLKTYNCDIIILDDGFQHLQISRTVDLALFDVEAFAGNSRVFPGGDLREPVCALKRSSAFVLTGVNKSNISRAEKCSALLSEKFMDKDIFQFKGSYPVAHRYDFSKNDQVQDDCVLNALPSSLFCFCGIANPQRFRQLLHENGISFIDFKAFRDHHHYTHEALENLATEAKSSGATGLLTTEKDMAKIRNMYHNDLPLYTLPIEFDQNPEFNRFIQRFISK